MPRERKTILAICDWKNPQDLIDTLVKQLPTLGVYAKNIDTKSDSYAIVVSDRHITQEQAQKVFDEGN